MAFGNTNNYLTLEFRDENFQRIGRQTKGRTSRQIRTKELTELEQLAIANDFQRASVTAMPKFSYTEQYLEESELNEAEAQSSVHKLTALKFEFADGSTDTVLKMPDIPDSCFLADSGEGANFLKPLADLDAFLAGSAEKSLADIINRFLPTFDADGNYTGEQEFQPLRNGHRIKRYLGGERI